MKKAFLIFVMTGLVMAVSGQNEVKNKKIQSIKLGSFFQNDFYFTYDNYETDYYYYTRHRSTEQGGYFFGGYEYLILFPGKKAVSLEPKAGVMLMNDKTGFFAGHDAKFFWKNTPYYRLGVSLYAGYRYININRTEVLSLDNGMYEQTLNYKANLHHIDLDISLIPFQFTFPGGFILESSMGLGFSWRIANPDESGLTDEARQQLEETTFHPYFPKFGLKIGYVLNSKNKSNVKE
jgi:hypothetical protein